MPEVLNFKSKSVLHSNGRTGRNPTVSQSAVFVSIVRINITAEGTTAIGSDFGSTTYPRIDVTSNGDVCVPIFLINDQIFEEDETIVLTLEVITPDVPVDILTPKITYIITDNDGKNYNLLNCLIKNKSFKKQICTYALMVILLEYFVPVNNCPLKKI